jgi:D-alanyl-D-alanine dipeptidase
LKVIDAYRPYKATVYFYEKVRDSVFVSVPWKGSRHNRGCAVDVSIVTFKTGKEIEMPTGFDDFSVKAHPDYMKLSGKVLKNRSQLITIMKKHGFTVYPAEWWHFDYQGWEKYALMDVSFESLMSLQQ